MNNIHGEQNGLYWLDWILPLHSFALDPITVVLFGAANAPCASVDLAGGAHRDGRRANMSMHEPSLFSAAEKST